jgi:hypothetical protein
MNTDYLSIQCIYSENKSCVELKGTQEQCVGCMWNKDYTYTVSKTPHKCPICEGRGIVQGGFYTSLPTSPSISTVVTEPCRACAGSGIIYA